MSNSILVRSDATLGVSISPDAITLKESALATAALVGKVTNATEQDRAVEAQKELRRCLKLCEDSRKAVKEPVLAYGRAIDDTAKRFAEELREEETRIVTMVADFQALEAAKVRAAEAAKRLEEEKLERERQEALRRVAEQDAEIKRKLDARELEAARAQREAASSQERHAAASLALEIERQRKLAEAENHARLDAINDEHCRQVAALPTVEAARAEGQVVKFDWDIVCTDVWALARAHPMCVKIEPRLNEIRSLLDQGLKVAGVTARKVAKSSVRLAPERKAIEV